MSQNIHFGYKIFSTTENFMLQNNIAEKERKLYFWYRKGNNYCMLFHNTRETKSKYQPILQELFSFTNILKTNAKTMWTELWWLKQKLCRAKIFRPALMIYLRIDSCYRNQSSVLFIHLCSEQNFFNQWLNENEPF